MRKWCPNYEKEDGLETVLEVPVPEEMYSKMGTSVLRRQNMRSLLKSYSQEDEDHTSSSCPVPFLRSDQFMSFLQLSGSSIVPFQIQFGQAVVLPLKDCSTESCTAQYIVQQYLAATLGYEAHNAASNSMYAMGELKMVISEASSNHNQNSSTKPKIGGFVMWQKNPDLWYLELMVLGCNLTAGCDGKVAWSQASRSSIPSRGPPRPLRRFFQGLDPRSTANLFFNAVCKWEKAIKNEGCFVLRLGANIDNLKNQSTPNTSIIEHTIWGFSSQRSGLLIQLEDKRMTRKKHPERDEYVFYETRMISVLDDYRYVDGRNIAHSGSTVTTIYKHESGCSKKWMIEETWKIEEIDFNVGGLSMDYFLPPCLYQEGTSGSKSMNLNLH